MTRKEREKQKARRDKARSEYLTVSAENNTEQVVLTTVAELAEQGHKEVLIYGRTSSKNGKTQKLAGQSAGIVAELEANGIKAVAVHAGQESGKTIDLNERKVLKAAVKEAKQKNVPLIAATPSRFLRHPEFHPINNPDVQPTKAQWKTFRKIIGNVTIAVCYNPATTGEDEKILGTMGRKQAKFKRGKAWIATTVNRMRKAGNSYRDIANKMQSRHGVKLSYGTVRRVLLRGEPTG